MLAGSHRNAWPDETGTGGRTNRNTHMKHTWCEEHATDTIRLTTTSTRLGKKLQKEMFILRDNLTAFDILCEMESIIYGDAFVSKVSVNKTCENHYASI